MNAIHFTQIRKIVRSMLSKIIKLQIISNDCTPNKKTIYDAYGVNVFILFIVIIYLLFVYKLMLNSLIVYIVF